MTMSCCAAITKTLRRTITVTGALLGLALLVPAVAASVDDDVPGLTAWTALSPVPYSATGPDVYSVDYGFDRPGNGFGLAWRGSSQFGVSGGYRVFPASDLAAAGCRPGVLDVDCSRPFSPLLSSGTRTGSEFALGADWEPLDGLSMGLGYRHGAQPGGAAAEALLLPRVLDFLAPGWENSLDRASRNGDEVDLNLAYGFDAGLIGELELKVQLSHVLDPTPLMDRVPRLDGGIGILQPSSTQASIGFNWSRGNFSGNLSSHYADGLLIDGQLQSSGWTTVDINFAWRTPWNASLSVGAQNLLGQDPNVDHITPPEIDDVFSRVPYVRYEQDL